MFWCYDIKEISSLYGDVIFDEKVKSEYGLYGVGSLYNPSVHLVVNTRLPKDCSPEFEMKNFVFTLFYLVQGYLYGWVS